MFIPILAGSVKDQPHIAKIVAVLKHWKIEHKIHIASAHKTPEKVLEIIKEYNKVAAPLCFITVAGKSNALSGMVAANSIHPVIACPPFKDKHDMHINIHSTLQMPSNTPVLTVIDPENAALAAIRILGIGNKELQKKIDENIKTIKADV